MDDDTHSTKPDVAAPEPAPEPTTELNPLDAAQKDLATMKDQLLRLQADFDNFRKRTQREKTEVYQRANEDFFRELLPILDTFELGIATAAQHKTDEAVRNGFQLVHDQLNSTTRRFGLQPVDATSGAFDPHQHEALTHLPDETVPVNHVVKQTRKGYRLGERLLRPAQVIVSSGPANEKTSPAG